MYFQEVPCLSPISLCRMASTCGFSREGQDLLDTFWEVLLGAFFILVVSSACQSNLILWKKAKVSSWKKKKTRDRAMSLEKINIIFLAFSSIGWWLNTMFCLRFLPWLDLIKRKEEKVCEGFCSSAIFLSDLLSPLAQAFSEAALIGPKSMEADGNFISDLRCLEQARMHWLKKWCEEGVRKNFAAFVVLS